MHNNLFPSRDKIMFGKIVSEENFFFTKSTYKPFHYYDTQGNTHCSITVKFLYKDTFLIFLDFGIRLHICFYLPFNATL